MTHPSMTHPCPQAIPGWNREQLVNEIFEVVTTEPRDGYGSVSLEDDMPGLLPIEKDEPSPELIQSVREKLDEIDLLEYGLEYPDELRLTALCQKFQVVDFWVSPE